jgi:hypothetical protein
MPTSEADLRAYCAGQNIRRGYEDKIRAELRPVSWEEAGRLFFRAALEPDGGGA